VSNQQPNDDLARRLPDEAVEAAAAWSCDDPDHGDVRLAIAAALAVLFDDKPVILPPGWRGSVRPDDVLDAVLNRHPRL